MDHAQRRAHLNTLAGFHERAHTDRVVTSEEHHNLDLARSLMGITDAEAETLLHAIVAEAEAFFGEKVEGA